MNNEATPAINPVVKQQLKERVFVIVHGAVLPPQTDISGPVLVLKPGEGRGKFWLDRVPQMPPQPWPDGAAYVPRLSSFAVMHTVEAGTIDELVENFRVSLVAAATALCSASAVGPCVDVEKSRENAAVLGYVPGKAFSGPFLDEADPALLPFYQGRVAGSERLIVLRAQQAGERPPA